EIDAPHDAAVAVALFPVHADRLAEYLVRQRLPGLRAVALTLLRGVDAFEPDFVLCHVQKDRDGVSVRDFDPLARERTRRIVRKGARAQKRPCCQRRDSYGISPPRSVRAWAKTPSRECSSSRSSIVPNGGLVDEAIFPLHVAKVWLASWLQS